MMIEAHELILNSFTKLAIPRVILDSYPSLVILDSVIGGYCSSLLKSRGRIVIHLHTPVISKQEKELFSEIIKELNHEQKNEVVFYYRLLILVEAIILKYST